MDIKEVYKEVEEFSKENLKKAETKESNTLPTKDTISAEKKLDEEEKSADKTGAKDAGPTS
ncbi:hypothetical protein [Salmonella sp. s51228]|uniref:hypothetical protein n=1 Tax=Salmonella sp. s51228 TaxID=3159652 RepID=UPI003980ACEB